jgi:hypothetical protein
MKRYTNLDLYGSLSLQLDLECTSSGEVYNFSVNNSSFIRFTGTDPVLHGLNSGGSNKIVFITFNGSGTLTLKNESSSDTASSRIIIKEGSDLIINQNDGILLFYNSYISRWCTLNAASPNLKSINQSSGFNNFSDGRINLGSTVTLQNSGNYIMDASQTSFLRKSGGNCIITINNMSEGQTIKVLIESTGNSYTVQWNPSVKWSSMLPNGVSLSGNTLSVGSTNHTAPTPTSLSNTYDLYTIQKIGGIYLGTLSPHYS